METQILSFDTALQRLDGDLELFHDLASYFLEDAPELIDTIRTGLAMGDLKTAHRAAHSLRSLVANFDAKEAMATAHAVESQLAKGEVKEVRLALPHLAAEVETLCHALHSFVPRPS